MGPKARSKKEKYDEFYPDNKYLSLQPRNAETAASPVVLTESRRPANRLA